MSTTTIYICTIV